MSVQKFDAEYGTMKESGVGQYVRLSDYRNVEDLLSKSQARVKALEEQLADRTEKYKIAMDKGVDVLSYQLTKAENVLKEFSLGESQWLDGVECMHKAREYFRTKESQVT